MTYDPYKEKRCHDCNCQEGELHQFGCDMERCPFCGGQIIACPCCYKAIGYLYAWNEKFYGLPEKVYNEGLSNDEQTKWENILNREGRVPYIRWPNMCAYCGELWPELFKVSDVEWKKYIQIDERDKIVCKKCYDFIVDQIERVKH